MTEPPDYTKFDELLTAKERSVRDRVREFVNVEAIPLVADYYERGAFPAHLIPRMAELGLYHHHGPVADGLISHELERADAGLRSFVSVHVHLAGSAIRFYGSDEQNERYLPAMERGELIGAFSLTEPAHGSDPGGMETIARAVDGGFILNGHKRWSTNGLVADVVVVWAKLDGEVRGFLVDKGTKGYRPVEISRKLSFRMSVSSELFFEDCFLPAGQLLPDAKGLGGPLRCLSEARYGIVWGTAGAAEACFEEALNYSLAREQFGRKLAGFQLTQEKLANMYAACVQSKLLALHLGRLKERGQLHHTSISLGKRTNVRHAMFVARTARTVLGAHGITDAAVSLRHAANLETEMTYEGTDEVHALVLGRHLTGLDAFRG